MEVMKSSPAEAELTPCTWETTLQHIGRLSNSESLSIAARKQTPSRGREARVGGRVVSTTYIAASAYTIMTVRPLQSIVRSNPNALNEIADDTKTFRRYN